MGDSLFAVKTTKLADTCFKQSLIILFKTLGKDHVEVADVLANYAALLQSKKMQYWPKALGIYQDAIKIITATFGKDHPKVIKWGKITKELESKNIKVVEADIKQFYSEISQSTINLSSIPGLIEVKKDKE